jgi:hypothetical protein
MHGFAFEMLTWDTFDISYHAVFEVLTTLNVELAVVITKKKKEKY